MSKYKVRTFIYRQGENKPHSSTSFLTPDKLVLFEEDGLTLKGAVTVRRLEIRRLSEEERLDCINSVILDEAGVRL